MSGASSAGPADLAAFVSAVSRASPGISRGRLFFWVSALLLLNALAGDILRYLGEHGFSRAIVDLFGINLIVWLAAAAALTLLKEADPESPAANRLDWLAASLSIAAALIPAGTASALALTMVATYVFLSSPGRTPLRRASAILLSVCAAILWGRVVLALFSRTLLRLDGALVSLFGVRSDENQLFFARDPGAMDPSFVVAPGCSSLHSISIVLVFCALIHGWFNIRVTRKSLLVGAIAVATVVFINTLRLAAFAFFPAYFEEIHTGWIASAIAWTTILAIVAVVCLGMKREILQES